MGPDRLAHARGGRLHSFTDDDLFVTGFAWMPGSDGFLIAHGHPLDDRFVRLAIVDLKGRVVRPAMVVGGTDTALTRYFESPRLLVVAGSRPCCRWCRGFGGEEKRRRLQLSVRATQVGSPSRKRQSLYSRYLSACLGVRRIAAAVNSGPPMPKGTFSLCRGTSSATASWVKKSRGQPSV